MHVSGIERSCLLCSSLFLLDASAICGSVSRLNKVSRHYFSHVTRRLTLTLIASRKTFRAIASNPGICSFPSLAHSTEADTLNEQTHEGKEETMKSQARPEQA